VPVRQPELANRRQPQTITAVVIGGTSLRRPWWRDRHPARCLIVGSFAIGLSLVGVDNQYRVLAVGVMVILAVSIDQWIRKVRG
jgi:fructose transport system permease protein